MSLILLFVGAALVVAIFEPAIPPLTGEATASDGDSLRFGDERVRLIGIDAPELDQTCTRAGADWPCGKAARAALRELIDGQDLDCSADGRDRYGRVLARCRTDEGDLGARLVSDGFAVAYGDYFNEERAAEAAGNGVWAGAFEPPEEWRRTHGAEVAGFDALSWFRSLL